MIYANGCVCCGESSGKQAWCDRCDMEYRGDLVFRCTVHAKNIKVEVTMADDPVEAPL